MNVNPKVVVSLFVIYVMGITVGVAQPNSSAANKSLPELLAPVDSNDIQDVLDNNDLFLRQLLITAKRHRIVQVDTDLLSGERAFTFTPFEDAPHILRRKGIKQTYRERTKWLGEITFPAPGFDLEATLSDIELKSAKATALARKTIRDSHKQVKLTISQSVKRITPDQQAFFETDPTVPSMTNDATGLSENAVRTEVHTTIYANFTSRPYGGTYEIYHLQNNPEYHLVLEVDPAKAIRPGSAGNAEKIQRYNKLLGEINIERERRRNTKNNDKEAIQ